MAPDRELRVIGMNLIHTPEEVRLLRVRDALTDALASAYGVVPPFWLANEYAQLACTHMDDHLRPVEVAGGERD